MLFYRIKTKPLLTAQHYPDVNAHFVVPYFNINCLYIFQLKIIFINARLFNSRWCTIIYHAHAFPPHIYRRARKEETYQLLLLFYYSFKYRYIQGFSFLFFSLFLHSKKLGRINTRGPMLLHRDKHLLDKYAMSYTYVY